MYGEVKAFTSQIAFGGRERRCQAREPPFARSGSPQLWRWLLDPGDPLLSDLLVQSKSNFHAIGEIAFIGGDDPECCSISDSLISCP